MKSITVTMLSLLAAVVSACSGNSAPQAKTAAEKAADKKADSLALKVGVMQTADCLPAFVAETEGIYDSLGVSVRLRQYTSGLDRDVSLRKNSLQGAFTDTKRTDYLRERYSFKMETVMTTDMQWQLVANRLSRLYRPKQLTDKVIAMTRFSATDWLCDRMADSAKLSADRVFRIQVNDVDTRLKMLLNNEIDAAWLPEPQAGVARAHGHNVLAQSGAKGECLATLAFTAKTMADRRRSRQVKLFVEAYKIAKKKIDAKSKSGRDSLMRKYFSCMAD